MVDSLIDEATGVAVAAIAEFAAAHGVSTHAGRQLIGDAVALRDRLPRCWRQMTSLRLPAWKARLLAQAVASLSDEATSWVDAQAAVLGDRLGVRTIRRLVLLAQARFEPETVKDPARQRWVRIGIGTADGPSWIDGCLDTPDALDLDAALQLIAAELDEAADPDLRRAQALGVMARRMLGQPELPTETRGAPADVVGLPGEPGAGHRADGEHSTVPIDGAGAAGEHWTGGTGPFARPVMIYLHLDAHQLANDCGGVAEVGSTGQLVSIEQIRRWFGAAGSITIRPVIDLNTSRKTRGYQPTEVMREQIALRDRTCVFPHCNRVAHPVRQRRTGEYSHDADHITAYDSGGETSTDNLACLCRLHHLLKTHTGWRYDIIGPGRVPVEITRRASISSHRQRHRHAQCVRKAREIDSCVKCGAYNRNQAVQVWFPALSLSPNRTSAPGLTRGGNARSNQPDASRSVAARMAPAASDNSTRRASAARASPRK